MDESRFIDLKIDFSSESKPEYPSTAKMGDTLCAFRSTSFGNFTGNNGDEDFRSGGSCRITVNDRGIKRGAKTHEELNSIYSVSTFNFLSSSSSLESNDVSS